MSPQTVHTPESRSDTRPAEALVSGEVRELQAELQDTLRTLQEQQEHPARMDDDQVHQSDTFGLCVCACDSPKAQMTQAEHTRSDSDCSQSDRRRRRCSADG